MNSSSQDIERKAIPIIDPKEMDTLVQASVFFILLTHGLGTRIGMIFYYIE